MSQSTTVAITLVVYQLLLVAIGLWTSRRVHDSTDYLLGGRDLGAWVAGLSYAASTSSAWVLLESSVDLGNAYVVDAGADRAQDRAI